jgi:hypothetical protein
MGGGGGDGGMGGGMGGDGGMGGGMGGDRKAGDAIQEIIGTGKISGQDIRELLDAGISDQKISNLIENRGAGNNATNVANQFGINIPGRMAGERLDPEAGGDGKGDGKGGANNTVTNIPTQSLDLQTLLSSLTRVQDQSDLLFAAKLDRENSEFFTGQSLRPIAALGAENRLTERVQGERAACWVCRTR